MSRFGSNLGQRLNASLAASVKISLASKTVTFPEFGHASADYTNEWLPIQTIMPLYNAYTLMPTQNKNPHRIFDSCQSTLFKKIRYRVIAYATITFSLKIHLKLMHSKYTAHILRHLQVNLEKLIEIIYIYDFPNSGDTFFKRVDSIALCFFKSYV